MSTTAHPTLGTIRVTRISKPAVDRLRKSTPAITRLTERFGVTRRTVRNWFDERNDILTTPDAVRIALAEVPELQASEILVSENMDLAAAE